ncbi:hypothetical protein [Ferrimonas futtsuensis]|uniref:hypothetical protein n=1 Tax=Ferrimonas futtsuensis TaxID=364764 RepID=UPI000684BCB7|nr:hypothetical protein [Ferrimonas futtsuensis]
MNNKDEQNMAYPPYGYPPVWPPHPMHGYPPHPMHGYHPHAMPPQGYGVPPQGQPQMPHGYPPHHHSMPPHGGHHDHHHSDPLMAQSQQMLEGLMGDQAGIFKDLLHKLGVDDKEFWKGAMIGAAAALILSNENVRGNLMSMLGNAGDLLKTGTDKVKQTATQTASNVGSNVSMGTDVFKDTLAAGKAGFKESVERHRSPEPQAAPQQETTPEAPTEPHIKAQANE